MYTIKTDKEFFERFKDLETQIKELSFLFQNSGMIASPEEVKEWQKIAYKTYHNLNKLLRDAENRIIQQ